ncbi:MAG: hypothetical protein LBE91_10430 [Tannerella sp.]|jgi:hypothetical protein|nr:hypothetical protein [Tannerella sp.]
MRFFDFIITPLTTGITFYFIYMTFELFVRKQERLRMIEKLGMNLAPADPNIFKAQFNSLLPALKSKSFLGLRIGSLLIGIGLGLLVGFFLHLMVISGYGNSFEDLGNWQTENLIGVGYGASVLLFGGLGLIVSFIIENRMSKKKENEAS